MSIKFSLERGFGRQNAIKSPGRRTGKSKQRRQVKTAGFA